MSDGTRELQALRALRDLVLSNLEPFPRTETITASAWNDVRNAARTALFAASAPALGTRENPEHIHMFCPHCGMRHTDRGEWATWPHHGHRCEHCLQYFDSGAFAYGEHGSGGLCQNRAAGGNECLCADRKIVTPKTPETALEKAIVEIENVANLPGTLASIIPGRLGRALDLLRAAQREQAQLQQEANADVSLADGWNSALGERDAARTELAETKRLLRLTVALNNDNSAPLPPSACQHCNRCRHLHRKWGNLCNQLRLARAERDTAITKAHADMHALKATIRAAIRAALGDT